jgi:pyruvate,water dikinase
MAQLARRPSCRQWFQDFLDYCRRYGHAGARLDFLYPTAADDPARAMEDLQIRMDLPACDPVERQRRLIAERESATREAVEGLSGFRFRKALFCWALRWAQQGAAIREDVFFHALRGAPLARQTVLTLGRRLWERGALADPEDIFFLTWEELQEAVLSREAGDWRAAIAQRRRDRHLRTRLTPPPCVPLEGPPETLGRHFMLGLRRLLLGAGCQSENGVLRGAPVSPGTATGPARVIHSPAEFDRLRNGDILVTHTATPEWMILCPLAAGLVTDTGGPLSHSSIVAREFGLPAVMGVQRATLEIADGQLVTVDGNEGLVCLH